MNRLRIAAIALGLALAGCMTPPNVTVREHRLDATDVGLGQTAAPTPVDAWWRAYGDAQLDKLMERALANNPTLAQALARLRGAEAAADSAYAGKLPSVSLDAAETRQRFSRDDVVPPPYAGGVHSEGRTLFTFAWDIDFWGRQSALVEAARARTTATALDLSGARLAVTGAMLEAYIELDRQYALADLAERSTAQRRQILDITRRRVGAGLETNVELREAEGAVPKSLVELKAAQADRARAAHLIAALSGQGADAYAGIERPRWQLDAALALPSALPADLLGRRPDVLAARARVDAATSNQAAAKAAFYPDVDLAAFAGVAAIGAGNLLQTASATYGVGPAIHLPLFDGGRLKAEYRRATAEIDESIAAYNAAVLGAVREAADALTRIDALGDEIGEQRKSLDAAEAAYRLASERYAAGLSDYLTVLNAETEVLSARRERVELAAAQARARVALMLAVGGDFDARSAAPAVVAN
ncbi:MAG TPA: efflux transporter outer membrane subunit [Rudaea sp.]|nr:efflux transporter outer membrane subunit [Rudaea sp.]